MAAPKHIVAVAGLVTDPTGRVLMIRTPRGDWEFPGGQVEEGEDLITALKREILEETGMDVAVGNLAGVYSNTKSHLVIFDFICKPVSGETRTSVESLDVQWVEREITLGQIIRTVIRDRLKVMLDFAGKITYRAYEFDANELHIEYIVHCDRPI